MGDEPATGCGGHDAQPDTPGRDEATGETTAHAEALAYLDEQPQRCGWFATLRRQRANGTALTTNQIDGVLRVMAADGLHAMEAHCDE